jgi:hypothetical protein
VMFLLFVRVLFCHEYLEMKLPGYGSLVVVSDRACVSFGRFARCFEQLKGPSPTRLGILFFWSGVDELPHEHLRIGRWMAVWLFVTGVCV